MLLKLTAGLCGRHEVLGADSVPVPAEVLRQRTNR